MLPITQMKISTSRRRFKPGRSIEQARGPHLSAGHRPHCAHQTPFRLVGPPRIHQHDVVRLQVLLKLPKFGEKRRSGPEGLSQSAGRDVGTEYDVACTLADRLQLDGLAGEGAGLYDVSQPVKGIKREQGTSGVWKSKARGKEKTG
jgi:hypothetical protein